MNPQVPSLRDRQALVTPRALPQEARAVVEEEEAKDFQLEKMQGRTGPEVSLVTNK